MEIIYKTLQEKVDVPMSNEELSDLGVELHNLDIRTGENSSSVKSHFLPRIDFPDLQDSPMLLDFPLLEDGSFAEQPENAKRGYTFRNYFKEHFNSYFIDDFKHHAVRGEKLHQSKAHRGCWVQSLNGHGSFSGWQRKGMSLSASLFKSDWRLKRENSKSPKCHKHKGHRCSLVRLVPGNCPGCDLRVDLRPGNYFILLRNLRKKWRKILAPAHAIVHGNVTLPFRSIPSIEAACLNYQLTQFQHLTIMADDFGGWRVFQSYFDGTFHVSFTNIVDLEHLLVEPQEGEKYFNSVDKADYVKKTNMILKWAWPLTQDNGVIADPLLDKEDTLEIFMSCLVSR